MKPTSAWSETHARFRPDAEAVFDQAFSFLRTNALAVPEGAEAVPIVGYEP